MLPLASVNYSNEAISECKIPGRKMPTCSDMSLTPEEYAGLPRILARISRFQRGAPRRWSITREAIFLSDMHNEGLDYAAYRAGVTKAQAEAARKRMSKRLKDYQQRAIENSPKQRE